MGRRLTWWLDYRLVVAMLKLNGAGLTAPHFPRRVDRGFHLAIVVFRNLEQFHSFRQTRTTAAIQISDSCCYILHPENGAQI